MSSLPLSPMVASAAALARALRALAGLAEALGAPGTVAAALAEAEAALAEAEAAVRRLEAELVSSVAAAAPVAPTPGLNVEGLYRLLEAMAKATAEELDRELKRNRRRRRALWLLRTSAVVLMVVCAPLLALDVVREALSMTQESHLIPCLAAVALVAQVALWGAETSKHHLSEATSLQHCQAQRYQHLAQDAAAAAAAAAAATAQAAQDITNVHVTLGVLEEVTSHLRALVDAVIQDQEAGRGFPTSTRALGDAVVALGTVMGDKEMTEKLTRALEALPGDK
ncbi:uncharacterized protein LOC127396194 isoform X2 [Apus apus]|nr:uncharacterized protein LOC127396194 isoform X2 [Apus apus]XP_051499772.1 uncharacterized protein LOC127396194 isoform X2 [Apus apus]